jgi:hypothetical protein
MNDRIRSLLDQMSSIEDQLRAALQEGEAQVHFVVKGKRVEFERGARDAHRKLKRSILRWIVTNRPQNFITGPIIYGCGFPILFLDLSVTFYQLICFPVYGIARVRRGDYMIYDRKYLSYLNWFERLHCEYCAYANGAMAYMAEVLARTEEYFCPIKHAHKSLGTHKRYRHFLEYGDAADYHGRLEEFRREMNREREQQQAVDARKAGK